MHDHPCIAHWLAVVVPEYHKLQQRSKEKMLTDKKIVSEKKKLRNRPVENNA